MHLLKSIIRWVLLLKTHYVALKHSPAEENVITRCCRVALFEVFHSVEENIKQADQVCWAGHVLRVELNAAGAG